MYIYEQIKPELFTDGGQKMFLAIRDAAHKLLEKAGAFREAEVLAGICGNTWEMSACVDRMVELGEIIELKRDCWEQYRVFTTPKVDNR